LLGIFNILVVVGSSNWSSQSFLSYQKPWMNICCFSLRVIVTEHIKTCADRTKEKINWLMDLERRAFTLNTHYYSDYKDKFLAYYRACREKSDDTTSQLMKVLRGYRLPTTAKGLSNSQVGMVQVLAALPQVGINGVKAVDLAKLLPPDPMEPALNVMAGVRAYFQGWANSSQSYILHCSC
jgi:hypothetical protein